jgi:hypothetical protein
MSIGLQGIGFVFETIRGKSIAKRHIENPILAGPGISFAPKNGAMATMGKTLASVKKKKEKKYSGFAIKISVYLSNKVYSAPPCEKISKDIVCILHDHFSKP